MELMKMLADALRNFSPQGPSPVNPGLAKGALGQSGAAQRVNPASREEYLRYVEQEISEGREPQRYDQWIGGQAMRSQVGG